MKKTFLEEEQIPEFITALKGRSEIPLKFVYLKEGAQNWDELVKDKSYALGKIETNLILKNMNKILFFLKNKKINLLDVGCGNGEKAIPIIEALSKTHNPVNYIVLDISDDMLALAIKNITTAVKNNLNTQTFVIDFEKGNFAQITDMLRKVYYTNNLILMLGNTIGNPFDKDRVLTNLRESMTVDDYLLLGIELIGNENIDYILSHYKNEPLYKAIFFCLEKIGVKRSDGRFDIFYNEKRSQVEMHFVFEKNRKVKFSGEVFEFINGDRVLLAISYKSTKSQLNNLLSSTGFKINAFFTNKEENYALVLCQPVKF